ncbi:MAG: RNA methyltransferase [Candidatus Daviesbacteria bacterium]|nr:RNA methyltransferase [Candidatus Daviesbacteria bacterium]
MKRFAEVSRAERIKKILSQRRVDLVLVLENLAEDQNISAILRTAEGFGVGRIFIIYPEGKKPRLSNNISSGAIKWLEIKFYTSTEVCLEELKKEGFKIYATYVNPEAKSLWKTKFPGKVALVVGNEAQGISEEVIKFADKTIYLPMMGMTESFNVSVAAAIFLYEVVRQKEG